jgi:hypothetical protein
MDKKKKIQMLMKRFMAPDCLFPLKQEDINFILKLGNEFRLTRKKGAKEEGAMLFIEGTGKLTIDNVHKIRKCLRKKLIECPCIFCYARIDRNRKHNKSNVVYIYQDDKK